MVVELSRSVRIYVFLWIFEYYLTSKSLFIRKGCQIPGRYAKLEPSGFHSIETEWKLRFEFKRYDHFVRQTKFSDFDWRQPRYGYGIWNFLSYPFNLPLFIIMTFLKLAGLEGEEAIWFIPWRNKGLPETG